MHTNEGGGATTRSGGAGWEEGTRVTVSVENDTIFLVIISMKRKEK